MLAVILSGDVVAYGLWIIMYDSDHLLFVLIVLAAAVSFTRRRDALSAARFGGCKGGDTGA